MLAVPVAPLNAVEDLRKEADDVVCLETPEPFFAIGLYYRDFHQISDEEVIRLLLIGWPEVEKAAVPVPPAKAVAPIPPEKAIVPRPRAKAALPVTQSKPAKPAAPKPAHAKKRKKSKAPAGRARPATRQSLSKVWPWATATSPRRVTIPPKTARTLLPSALSGATKISPD